MTSLMVSHHIGSGNGLVPSGNKPLPEPMLAKVSVAFIGHNGLIKQSFEWLVKLDIFTRKALLEQPRL